MSDIPVGSPPAPPGRHAAPGGWYPDPLDLARERYWDGWQWSRNTRESEVPPAYRQAPGAPAARPTVRGSHAAGAAAVRQPAARSQPRRTGRRRTTAARAPASRQAATDRGRRAAGRLVVACARRADRRRCSSGRCPGCSRCPSTATCSGRSATFWNAALAAAQAGAPPPATPNFAAMMTGTDQLLVTAVTFAIGMAYHLPLLRTRGATLGLLACGLQVVPVDEGRSTARLGWSTVVVRALLWVLPGRAQPAHPHRRRRPAAALAPQASDPARPRRPHPGDQDAPGRLSRSAASPENAP